MYEIRLWADATTDTLISFDGHVVEFFSARRGESGRIHVAHISRIEVRTDRSGSYLDIYSTYVNQLMFGGNKIQPANTAKVQEMVDAVRVQMAAWT
jgi:hypothetical protein